MAVTQPTLGGSAFPWPQHDGGYQVRYEYRGGVAVMADGSLSFDLVATGMKRIVTLTWLHLNETDRNTVQTRLTSLALASATLVSPEGDSITVTLDENMTLPTWAAIGVPNGDSATPAGNNIDLRYSGSVTLREV